MSAPVDTGNMAWMLASTALVQLMTPGLAFFYGGLVSESSVVNTMMLSMGTMGIVTWLWGMIGYSLAFGPNISTNVVGGNDYAVLNFGDQLRVGLGISEHTFMVFQLTFAIITAAIISGAIVQKMKYIYFMAFVALWHIFVYCPLAHYLFSYNGWLVALGAIDFAGGMVVHTSSGVSAFVLAFWLGKSKVRPVNTPHNVPYVLLGASLLWFGWFGFNAGSAGAADYQAGRAFVNTQFAAAFAMLTWGVLEIVFNGEAWFTGRPTAVGAACGVVTGLVGITPGAGFVTPMWAYFIGFFTTLVVFFVPRVMKYSGVDDRLDCFAFHGIGGMVGSLLTGLFATEDDNGSLAAVQGGFYGNGLLFAYQIVAILVTVAFSVVGTTVIYWLLRGAARLLKDDMRIPEAVAHDIDASQHGEKAYFRSVSKFEPVAPIPVADEPKNETAVDIVEQPTKSIDMTEVSSAT